MTSDLGRKDGDLAGPKRQGAFQRAYRCLSDGRRPGGDAPWGGNRGALAY